MVERDSWWSRFLEWLVPASALIKSASPKWDLAVARFLVLSMYCGLVIVFLVTLWFPLLAGHVQVFRRTVKLDAIEAPSVAICPFWPGLNITRPAGSWTDAATVKYVSLDGTQSMNVTPFTCVYDRECICVPLYKQADGVPQLHDYEGRRSEHTGTLGGNSYQEMKFKDRVEISTNLMDPSGDETLKLGLYDSIDHSPNWFYAKQGGYIMGSLELQKWTVMKQWSARSLLRFVRGDLDAMARHRHVYRFVMDDVGKRGAAGRQWNETRLSYEMNNFFVDETVSSETAWSAYTLLFLLFLVIVRSAIVSIFVDLLLPKAEDATLTNRELAGWALVLGHCFCCCCGSRLNAEDEEEGVTQALLQ